MNSSRDNRGSKIDEERTGEGEQEEAEREMSHRGVERQLGERLRQREDKGELEQG